MSSRSQPLISVNITTYNRHELLPRCLDSVLSQDYTNMEVIIVDDCSTDNTEEVVKSYQKKDTRVKYYRHFENKGNAEARNTAIKEGGGEYVAFMDDDDEWVLKNKLTEQLKILETIDNGFGIVCGGIRTVFSDESTQVKIPEHPGNMKSHILKQNGLIYSPTVLTSRKMLEATNGFDCRLKRGVDSDFYRNAILNFDCKIVFYPFVVADIYEHRGPRITPSVNRRTRSLEEIKNILYQFFKYRVHFLKNFPSLKTRLISLAKNSVRVITG